MAPPLKRCAAPGCTEMIHRNQLMCRPHWCCVTEEHKQEVWATWKELREAKLSETIYECSRLYRFAVAHAVQDVEAANKKRKRA